MTSHVQRCCWNRHSWNVYVSLGSVETYFKVRWNILYRVCTKFRMESSNSERVMIKMKLSVQLFSRHRVVLTLAVSLWYHQTDRVTHAACRHSERRLLQLPFYQTPLERLSETISHATKHFCNEQKHAIHWIITKQHSVTSTLHLTHVNFSVSNGFASCFLILCCNKEMSEIIQCRFSTDQFPFLSTNQHCQS